MTERSENKVASICDDWNQIDKDPDDQNDITSHIGHLQILTQEKSANEDTILSSTLNKVIQKRKIPLLIEWQMQ